MEELRMLVEMVATLTVWVLFGYLVYQLSIMASIYATIRFCVTKVWEYLTVRRTVAPLQRIDIDGITITGAKDSLKEQLKRLAGKRVGIRSDYIHKSSVEWLAEAITEKEVRDSEAKK
jgi:small-conductance mechanosensitive channel